jgi:hypothetical protein
VRATNTNLAESPARKARSRLVCIGTLLEVRVALVDPCVASRTAHTRPESCWGPPVIGWSCPYCPTATSRHDRARRVVGRRRFHARDDRAGRVAKSAGQHRQQGSGRQLRSAIESPTTATKTPWLRVCVKQRDPMPARWPARSVPADVESRAGAGASISTPENSSATGDPRPGCRACRSRKN